MNQDSKPTVGRESDKFMLRFPEGMRERISEVAKQNGRSMNAEIITRLEATFTGSVDDRIMASTVARLNLNLATAEFRKYSLEAESHSLALLVQRAADLLLDRLAESDDGTKAIIRELAIQAQPYIRDIQDLDQGLSERVTKVKDAAQQMNAALQAMMERLGHTPDAAVMNPDGTLAILQVKRPPPPLAHSSDDAPVEPPRRRVRIRKDPKA